MKKGMVENINQLLESTCSGRRREEGGGRMEEWGRMEEGGGKRKEGGGRSVLFRARLTPADCQSLESAHQDGCNVTQQVQDY